MSPDMINSSQARFFKPLNLDSKLILADFELVFHSFKKPRGPSNKCITRVNNHNHHHDWTDTTREAFAMSLTLLFFLKQG